MRKAFAAFEMKLEKHLGERELAGVLLEARAVREKASGVSKHLFVEAPSGWINVPAPPSDRLGRGTNGGAGTLQREDRLSRHR